jgi:hypothetical protein
MWKIVPRDEKFFDQIEQSPSRSMSGARTRFLGADPLRVLLPP